MEANVRVKCECGTGIVVMPPEVFKAIEQGFGQESEIDFSKRLAKDEAQTGDRLAIWDAKRVYTCPECGRRGQIPPAEELSI
jgi:hypothetical protein